MKSNKIKEEFRTFNVSQLKEKLDQVQRDLFSLRLNAQTGHVKDNSQFSLMRKNIARIQTIIKEKDNK